MSEPLMPPELWMFWATLPDRSFWLNAIDETSGADDLYLVTFSEESAERVAQEQLTAFFDGDHETITPVRVHPTPGPATAAMLEWAQHSLAIGLADRVTRVAFQSFLDEWKTP